MIKKTIIIVIVFCIAFGLILPSFANSIANAQISSSNVTIQSERQDQLLDASARLDQQISSILQSTPQPTHTPIAIAARITHTPKPTSTPLAIPPSSDPRMGNFMILFGVLIVLVILAGVWLNRRRAF